MTADRAPVARFVMTLLATVALAPSLAGCSETVTSDDVTVDDAPLTVKTQPDPHAHHNHAPAADAPSGSLDAARRLARLNGHVAAGLALYRSGDTAVALRHLQHPISDHHASERVGLDELGLDKAPFEAVVAAIEAGRGPDESAPLMAAVETHLLELAARAGGDPLAIIQDLIDVLLAQYEVAVPGETVANVGPYQDAFGFAIVARTHAASIKGEAGDSLRGDLDTLLGLWPAGPRPPAQPATLAAVRDQINRIRDVLRYAR